MSNEEQKTLLETIQVILERNEKGSIDYESNGKGGWRIVKYPNHPMIRYFEPNYIQGYDPYGSPEIEDEPTKP
jgi:hypothetical protein